jgi:hypothetical protein
MCNQEQGFHRGFWKFIAKIHMTVPICADINLCLYSYLYLNSKSSDITIHTSKSQNILSDSSLTNMLRPDDLEIQYKL